MFCFFRLSADASKKHPFPCPTTYRIALSHYLDITHTPRTNVLKELAEYAENPEEQEFLRKMASSAPEGKVSKARWVASPVSVPYWAHFHICKLWWM